MTAGAKVTRRRPSGRAHRHLVSPGREWEIVLRLWQSIVSIWAWLVLVLAVLVFFPLMALVRLATLSDRGRYAVGYLFRRIGVVEAALNPLWHFRSAGSFPADPRHPYVVVSNHESFADILLISHLPWE